MAQKDLNPKLNNEQAKAVKFGNGSLLIIAGAGTGKTTVITERIKYLIAKKKAKASEILALTFTEKSAREMEERVDIAMPYGYTQMWIMTFHSFCDRILRQEALHIGLDPNYKLMTEAETVQLLRKNLFKMDLNYFRPLGNPNKFVSGMLQHFSRLQDEAVEPNDYVSWINKQKSSSKEDEFEIDKWKELSKAYKTYDEIKIREGLMDYGDLIIKTLKVFRDRPNILNNYQKQFKYFLVDEFQDTNFAQNELVKILVGKEGNITVVGDDDQSIYKFRGAAVSNIIQFRKNFPKTEVIVLTRNYRSTQNILDRSYELIKHNDPDRLEVVEKINKKLISESKNQGFDLEFLHADRVENEAEMIAKKIKELKVDFKDIAILVRANNHSESIIRALQRNAIPYQFLGPGRLFRQPEIIDLISFLKVLYNYEDSVAFYRVLGNDHFNIEGRDIASIGNFARKYNKSLFEAAENIDQINVSEKTKQKVSNLIKIFHKIFDRVKKDLPGQLLYDYLKETGLLKKLLSPESAEAETRAKNISKFFDKLKTYEVGHNDATLFTVVDWLDLSMEMGESPLAANEDWTEVNAVNILTVHSAKGLEFPVVFLVNLVSQRFPTTERHETIPIPDSLIKEFLPIGDYHLEEERRLFYVGMTRAKERLFLTAANYYGEGKREKKISQFVYEAIGEEIKKLTSTYDTNSKQLTFLDYGGKLKEANSPSQKIKIDYLSVSQIEAFQICPLHYKLRYIYKLPSEPMAPTSFGISMHRTVRDFYDTVKNGEKPTEKLILALFQKEWIKIGYKDKLQEEGYLKSGKNYLTDFLKKEFKPNNLPVLMEEKFSIKLDNTLTIGGTFDRVDEIGQGAIEIIDYKTGEKLPTQKEVDNNMQLGVYALAATKINNSIFNKKPEQIRLSLYYFNGQQKISTTRTAKDLEKLEKQLFEIRDQIEKSDFACSNHIFCQMGCEFDIFCKSETA